MLRANGLRRAVPEPAGRRRVRFECVPPGFAAGILAAAAALIGIVGVVTWPRIL